MSAGIDLQKQIREQARWLILISLDAGRPESVYEDLILSAINAVPVQITRQELHKEMDYLETRGLISISGKEDPSKKWSAKLTRAGMDVVEYTEPCDPGIARPPKWWD